MRPTPQNQPTVARVLIQELRGTTKSALKRLAAGSLESRYPVVRDHQAVLALTDWLAAVDAFVVASRSALKAIPPSEARVIVGELGGFTRRAANLIRLKVG